MKHLSHSKLNSSFFIAVYTQNVTVYASEGDNVTIKCKLFLNSKSTWDKVKTNGKYTVIPYADGDEINPDLPNKQTLAIVGNINEGDYHLQIQNVSFNDDGIYICSQRSNKQRILESYVTLKIIGEHLKIIIKTVVTAEWHNFQSSNMLVLSMEWHELDPSPFKLIWQHFVFVTFPLSTHFSYHAERLWNY